MNLNATSHVANIGAMFANTTLLLRFLLITRLLGLAIITVIQLKLYIKFIAKNAPKHYMLENWRYIQKQI